MSITSPRVHFAYCGVCVERSLAKWDNWNPKMSPEAVKWSHRCCYIVSWLRFWPTMRRWKIQINLFFALNHLPLSQRVDCGTNSSTFCFSLPTTDRDRHCLPPAGAAWGSIGLNRHVTAIFPRINSAFFKNCSTSVAHLWSPSGDTSYS